MKSIRRWKPFCHLGKFTYVAHTSYRKSLPPLTPGSDRWDAARSWFQMLGWMRRLLVLTSWIAVENVPWQGVVQLSNRINCQTMICFSKPSQCSSRPNLVLFHSERNFNYALAFGIMHERFRQDLALSVKCRHPMRMPLISQMWLR